MEFKNIPPQVLEFVKYAAIIGLIATTALLINIENAVFRTLFQEKTKTYWWLFATFTIVPLFLFLYLFSLIFEK